MKPCKTCGTVKPLEEFYKHPKMADGRLNHCKDCKKSYATQHRNENIEAAREYDIKRAQKPHRKANRQEVTSRMRENHPDKAKAHRMVTYYLRTGGLVRPASCERCPRTTHIHGHHDDYSKPLDVTWLCPVCHKVRHAELDVARAA